MSAALTVLAFVALVAVIFCGPWLAVYVPAARREGYRMFSHRRWVAWKLRTAECHGGPLDGERLPVTRSAIAGGGGGEWPDVLFNAYTGTYSVGQRRPGEYWNYSAVWAGYYMLRHLSDRYEWQATSLERYALAALAEGPR